MARNACGLQGASTPATGHLQSLRLLCQAVWLFHNIALQLSWNPGLRETPEPSSGLWLQSHTQHILLWYSDRVFFSERIIVKIDGEERNGALSLLGGGQDHTHTPHAPETYVYIFTHAHTHTDSLINATWILLKRRSGLKGHRRHTRMESNTF